MKAFRSPMISSAELLVWSREIIQYKTSQNNVNISCTYDLGIGEDKVLEYLKCFEARK